MLVKVGVVDIRGPDGEFKSSVPIYKDVADAELTVSLINKETEEVETLLCPFPEQLAIMFREEIRNIKIIENKKRRKARGKKENTRQGS